MLILIISFSLLSIWRSLQPLLVRDGLFIPMVSLVTLSFVIFFLFHGDSGLMKSDTQGEKIRIIILLTSFYCFVILSIASMRCPPSKKWPDLFPLAFATLSCGHFVLFFILFNAIQVFPKSRLSQYVIHGTWHDDSESRKMSSKLE